MIYKYSYNSNGTKKCEDWSFIPKEARLILKTVGENHKDIAFDALESYWSDYNQTFNYREFNLFTSSKLGENDISFYVEPEEYNEISKFVRNHIENLKKPK